MSGLVTEQSGKPMGIRAYSRRCGRSASSVLRAIASTRLQKSVVYVRGTPQIADPDLADQEWAANTDLSRARGEFKERPAGGAVPPVPAAPGTPGTPSRLTQASAAEKEWKAKQAELSYRREAGELVEVAKVEAAWFEMCVMVRNALLVVPAKVKLIHLDAPRELILTVDQQIRRALEGLASDWKATR